MRELAGVASAEGSGAEGNRTDWAPLLEAELARARQIQDEMPALRGGREAEQAVIAVFLHSQPIGHKAYTPELVRLTGSCAPDGIELLGWEEVHAQLTGHEVDAVQAERLRRRLQEARGRVPETVRQAYAVVVTVNERNAVHAFKLAASSRPLFTEIKNDDRSRIKETPVDAGRCCPTDPTSCGAEGEDARLVKDLAGAFARHPRLPKVLTPRVLLDTVLQGVQRGLLVGRLARPDGSIRTWWREPVVPAARDDPQLEGRFARTGGVEHLVGCVAEAWRAPGSVGRSGRCANGDAT